MPVGDDGSPIAYRVRDLVPGKHSNIGKLVPALTGEHDVPQARRENGAVEIMADDLARSVCASLHQPIETQFAQFLPYRAG